METNNHILKKRTEVSWEVGKTPKSLKFALLLPPPRADDAPLKYMKGLNVEANSSCTMFLTNFRKY